MASIKHHSDHIRQTVLSGVTYKITVTSSLADVINVLNGKPCEPVIGGNASYNNRRIKIHAAITTGWYGTAKNHWVRRNIMIPS